MPKKKKRVIKRRVFRGWICPWHVIGNDAVEIVRSFIKNPPACEKNIRKTCKITVEVYQ